MAFYDLSQIQRSELVTKICNEIEQDLQKESLSNILLYFSDEDTYIRKAAYQSIGKIYYFNTHYQSKIIELLRKLLLDEDFKIRQTCINAAGEIGKKDFDIVQSFFDTGLFDEHHAVRNAVIGSMKKMGEVNPKAVLNWAGLYLHHKDKEIRREICHGIELRGRTHPEDILPLLKELQFDSTARVRNTLVHVIGQISYKKNCLETVIEELKIWENKALVAEALEEIIDVHYRYRNFSVKTQEEARLYIEKYYYNR